MQAAQSMPHFTLKKDKHTSRINVGAWSITATKRPILNGKEVEAAEKKLGMPLPEMTFGNNSLVLHYDPSSSTSQLSTSIQSTQITSTATDGSENGAGPSTARRIVFDAMQALESVAVGEGWEERVGGGVKVSMADKWSKRRKTPSLLSETPVPAKPVRPHDWTYSTCYAGSCSDSNSFSPSTSHSIPMTLLARRDPVLDQILYYEDVPLFEDELHDNGESIYNVRIRVMPHCFFILARLFVRVDNVLFRIHDTRIYHAFGSDEVVKEVSGMEAEYDEVKMRLVKPEDLSPLTDQNFVSEIMTALAARQRANQEGDALTDCKPWPGLDKRCGVLNLGSTT